MTALGALIEEHRGAFEHDWRNRFGKPLTIIGDRMTWGEAVRLTEALSKDPSTMITAAINGWDYPLSREGFALLDHFDLVVSMNTKKGHTPETHKMRPTSDKKTEKLGTRMSPEDLRAAMAAAGRGEAA